MGNDFFINSVLNLNVVTNLLQLEPLMSHLVHSANTQLGNHLSHRHYEKRTLRQVPTGENVKFLPR